jgi:enoyl-CoA hydratase
MSEPAAPSLAAHREGPVLTITAANPARLNAYTAAMWRALPDVVAAAEANPAVRVVVLRGAGEAAFSAGADISEFDTARTGDAAAAYDELNNAAFAALTGCRKPTIAMIHGHCLGGGLALALSCDLRLADDAARFAIPAAKLGLAYKAPWIAAVLRAVPPAFAKEILFTGRRLTAAEATSMGLVNRVVAKAQLGPEVAALAAEIAGNAPLSIAAAKETIDTLTRPAAALDTPRFAELARTCLDSRDYAEGRRAFMEKRKPVFEGR